MFSMPARSIAVAMALALAIAAAACPAQEPRLEPEQALARAREYYASGATAERVSVTLMRGDLSLGSSTLVVRLDPGVRDAGGTSDGADRADRPDRTRVLIEAGPLRLYAGAGSVVGVRADNEATGVTWDYAGALVPTAILERVPPMPLFELALGSGRAPDAQILLPYVSAVQWESAQRSPDGMRVALTGACSSGPVQLEIEARSGRLVACRVSRGGAEAITFAFEPIPVGDPDAWAIDTADRRLVGSIDRLVPRAPAIGGDESIDQLPVVSPDGSPWTLDAILPPVPRGADLRVWGVVVFVRERPGAEDPRTRSDVLAAFKTVADLRRQLAVEGQGDPDRSRAHLAGSAVIVYELERFAETQRLDSIEAWSSDLKSVLPAASALQPAARIFWSASARQTIDRFDPRAGAVVVLVDDLGRVLLSDRLDGLAQDPGRAASLSERWRRILNP